MAQADLQSPPSAGSQTPRPPLPDDAKHILIVDDDSRIRTLLGRFLGDNGYRVTLAADAAAARNALALVDFDGAIVDVMMPGEDGLSLAGFVKSLRDVPVMMLTAKAEGADRIKGLEVGADDYLAKPFEPRELLLRLRNLMKRRVAEPPVAPRAAVVFGAFVFDLKREELTENGVLVRLTDRERQLMMQFAESSDGTVLREALVANDGGIGERTIDVQINRLRRKLEADPANPIYLMTIRGIGYRLKFEDRAV